MSSVRRFFAIAAALGFSTSAFGFGPSHVYVHNNTTHEITVFAYGASWRGVNTAEHRIIVGPTVIKAGETKEVFQDPRGDLQETWLSVTSNGLPQWSLNNHRSVVLDKNDLHSEIVNNQAHWSLKNQLKGDKAGFSTGKIQSPAYLNDLLMGAQPRFVDIKVKGNAKHTFRVDPWPGF